MTLIYVSDRRLVYYYLVNIVAELLNLAITQKCERFNKQVIECRLLLSRKNRRVLGTLNRVLI